MLMIELAALENGAHRNQWTDGAITPPDGWAAVPEELEAKAAGYLPYILLTVEEGEITGVAQGAVPTPTPEPELEPDALTQTQLAVAELAQVVEDNNTAAQLAIAELAEALLGGETSV